MINKTETQRLIKEEEARLVKLQEQLKTANKFDKLTVGSIVRAENDTGYDLLIADYPESVYPFAEKQLICVGFKHKGKIWDATTNKYSLQQMRDYFLENPNRYEIIS